MESFFQILEVDNLFGPYICEDIAWRIVAQWRHMATQEG